jgi:hypothetical protein
MRLGCQGLKHVGLHLCDLPRFQHAQFAAIVKIQTAGDGEGRRALIAGDHHRAHASAMQLLQRRGDAGADGIRHAGEAKPDEIALVARVAALFADGDAKHAQRVAGHALIGLEHGGARGGVQRRRAILCAPLRASRQHFHRIALHAEQASAVRRLVQRAHPLASVAAPRAR